MDKERGRHGKVAFTVDNYHFTLAASPKAINTLKVNYYGTFESVMI